MAPKIGIEHSFLENCKSVCSQGNTKYLIQYASYHGKPYGTWKAIRVVPCAWAIKIQKPADDF